MNGNIKNIINERYGRLVVKEYKGVSKNQKSIWLCKCDCGNEKLIVSGSLINKVTKSCGCLLKENAIKLKYSHGFCGTKFYKIWMDMKDRCRRKTRKDYKHYGGRGITYDSKWENFLGFHEDMYFSYRYAQINKGIKKPSIERKNVNGNYNKENCTWIPLKDQHYNTRRNKWFKATSPDGIEHLSKIQSKFAIDNKLSENKINGCLRNSFNKSHKGWQFEYVRLKKVNLSC